jgi:hypothetical protein
MYKEEQMVERWKEELGLLNGEWREEEMTIVGIARTKVTNPSQKTHVMRRGVDSALV